MTNEKAVEIISQALAKATRVNKVITPETDLIEDGILDSLDGLKFAMEIEDATGLKVPDDVDLVEIGFYKLSKLIPMVVAGTIDISK